MAYTLVVNPGSTSRKYALFRGATNLMQVVVTVSGDKTKVVVTTNTDAPTEETLSTTDDTAVLQYVLTAAVRIDVTAETITAVGIRVVAPGSYFQTHRCVDAVYERTLQAAIPVAPLHVPPVRRALAALAECLPGVPVVAVSDSAFHATLPPVAQRYSIPAGDAVDNDIRRFGYHGLSVASVVRAAPSLLGAVPARHVVCHLGGGASVTALQDGVSVDTTMGFTPGSGLPMASRAGDLDPGALLEVMRVHQLHVADAHTYLQTRGGLHAFTGSTSFKHMLEQVAAGDDAANAALEHFAYHVRRAIAAAVATLGGVDAVTFTGTVGEQSALVRERCLVGLECMGITLDPARNDEDFSGPGVLSSTDNSVSVAVLPTDELGEMARATQQTLF